MTIGKCKTKTIQTDLGTFTHNQAYPGIIQAYSGIFKTMLYPEPEAYSESWHIHNPGIFRTPAYSEPWHIQNPRHIQNPVKHLQ